MFIVSSSVGGFVVLRNHHKTARAGLLHEGQSMTAEGDCSAGGVLLSPTRVQSPHI